MTSATQTPASYRDPSTREALAADYRRGILENDMTALERAVALTFEVAATDARNYGEDRPRPESIVAMVLRAVAFPLHGPARERSVTEVLDTLEAAY